MPRTVSEKMLKHLANKSVTPSIVERAKRNGFRGWMTGGGSVAYLTTGKPARRKAARNA